MVTKGGRMTSTEVFIKWLVSKYMPRYRLVSKDVLNEYVRQWRKKKIENEKKETTKNEQESYNI